MTGKQTVAGAYSKIESHERECALRYQALENGIADLKGGLKWAIGLIVGIAIGLISWLAVQVYDLNREAVRPDMSRAAASIVDLPSVASFKSVEVQ